MTGPSVPLGKPPKMMSSRLMTMKFMQRAAASKINENIPSHVQDVAEDLASSPSPKRRKLGSNPQKSRGIPNPELQQMQSAIYEDEAKKEKALEKLAKDTGETKWVLSQPVFQADESKKGRKNPQYLVIGDGQVEDHDRAYIGRRRFGVLSISHQKKSDAGVDKGRSAQGLSAPRCRSSDPEEDYSMDQWAGQKPPRAIQESLVGQERGKKEKRARSESSTDSKKAK